MKIISTKKIKINETALLIKQRPMDDYDDGDLLPFNNLTDFFLFSLRSDRLLKIAKFLERRESALGVQREHKKERDKQIGKFITSDHPFFPNTIIINIPLEFEPEMYNVKTKELLLTVPYNSAYVIDGQHRLRAFDSSFSKDVKLNMPVAAYFNLELPTIAEIFTRINYFQKPVSKSLVYDLLSFNGDPEFNQYKTAHEIALFLNDKIGSPFYSNIKMLGAGPGMISQAAFVEGLSTKSRVINLLKDFEDNRKASIIDSFFYSINLTHEKLFPKGFGLSRTVVFYALCKVLEQILIKKGVMKSSTPFDKYCKSLLKLKLTPENIKNYGGMAGVSSLSELFINQLNKDSLL